VQHLQEATCVDHPVDTLSEIHWAASQISKSITHCVSIKLRVIDLEVRRFGESTSIYQDRDTRSAFEIISLHDY